MKITIRKVNPTSNSRNVNNDKRTDHSVDAKPEFNEQLQKAISNIQQRERNEQ